MSKTYKTVKNNEISTTPPKYLGETAKEMYRTLAKYLKNDGKLDKIDENLVVLYAATYEIYFEAYDHIQKHKEVQAIYHSVQDSTGKIIAKDFSGYRKNPSVTIYSDAVAKLANLGSQLGLSPKSRAELEKIVQPKDDGDDESVDDLLNKGGGSF
ncbi:HNH endonuclease [Oenococcus oeni]|uniref:phage terminase small subunit P27 family n=1 Tax=Oenococcus oeni TaxID=1247 RepID=UPI0008F84BFB|nr:phage terminase small subunit P27 family [Oenococcus oeni]OIM49117.1 HNH endonuclease [Oenococcus oeni]